MPPVNPPVREIIAVLRPIQPRRFAPRTAIAEAATHAARIDAARFRADLDAVVDAGFSPQSN
jgi:hypothetical protein